MRYRRLRDLREDHDLKQINVASMLNNVHLTFYRLSAVIRDMSDIHRYSDHLLFSSQPLYTQ